MTAHDPRVTLTEPECQRIVACLPGNPLVRGDLFGVIADLIAARLAPIRALAEMWASEPSTAWWGEGVRAAVDAASAASAPVSAQQDHDGTEGQGEGERAGDLPWWIADGDPSDGAVPILGPFESRELALQVRRLFEAHEDALGLTYWIGQAPRPAGMRGPR